MEIDIDIDGELPVEMVQAILWEQHRGAEFTGEPWYLQPQNPASPPTEDEPFGINSGEPKQALYQVLHAEMQQELDSDRRFFLENPRRVHMVRPAFPVETQLLREQA